MASAGRFARALAAVALVDVLLGVLPAAANVLELFVLLAVLTGFRGNSLQGLAGGLAAGLVQDALTASVFGLHGLACCVVGYAVARASQRILTSQRVVAGILIAAGVLAHQVLVMGLLAVLEIADADPDVLVVLARALLTSAVGLAYLWLADRVREWTLRRRTLASRRVRSR